MKDTFLKFHPIVNFTWFTLVLVSSMTIMHPVMLGISFACAIGYSAYLTGGKAVRMSFKYLLPLMFLTAALNPVFNHEGATILRWLPSGNPLTRESIVYGIAAAVMLAAVIEWFACFNLIITSDKFVYLFGRVIPALSLVLSMTLRFVPRFAAQIKVVSHAQKCIGRDVSNGGVLQRAKNGLSILSIMITWVLENAIETADSMKSRGYGLPGRTAFSIYRFNKRDYGALMFTLACGGYVIAGSVTDGIWWQYYPVASGELSAPYAVSVFIVYLALCAMPLFLSIREDCRWKSLQSAI